jgi:twitching motility protein PilT
MSIKIESLLKKAFDMKASDLHIKAGSKPIIRTSGNLMSMEDEKRITAEDSSEIAMHIMNDKQKEEFRRNKDMDIAYSIPGYGRFRCNCFVQRGSVSIVFRVIPMTILEFEALHLPAILKKIAMEPRGLVLVTGTTGSGKSTTLASIIDYINTHKTQNVITIEDPIEYLHKDKNSIVSQREIGNDTDTFSSALRAAMRQDPDVILVGEMRDFETIKTALIAAETGHLVLSTLHTVDAVETINRIISVFPPYQHKQIRTQLASVLRAIVSMRLVPKAEEEGMVPAVEVLIATETIKGCIDEPEKTKQIPEFIAEGVSQYGMQTFDQSLLSLYGEGLITYEAAISRATHPDDFALRVKGVQSTKDLWGPGGDMSHDPDGPEIEKYSY